MSSHKENIHPDLAQIALDRVEGFAFERFSQNFLSVIEGRSFSPLGGVHDGGADGVYDCDNGRIYFQFSIQDNHREKLRKTYKRLIEFGRTVTTIYYLSSRLIPHTDREEDTLTDELGVIIKIRDRKYIVSHINDSIGTIAAYNNHLAMYTQFLASISRSDESFASVHVTDPTAYVFLQHEVTNRLGNRKLIHSLTDTMIIWALSDTDPEKGIFMTEGDIREKVFNTFPWAKNLLKGHIKSRLEILRGKSISGREVRWHKKENKYCLPYETRIVIKTENQDDEYLKLSFIDELTIQASDIFDADDGEHHHIAELCSKVVHSIFEKQGLLFSHFLTSEEMSEAPLIVADCIDRALTDANIPTNRLESYREYADKVLRKVFYHGSPTQRKYLSDLSRTYVLLFSLQAEPRIIEYFSTMSTSFKLFLGSDILVKALSERYLDEEDQAARNLLKMASAAGISMYLSECVLEEVYTHIRGTYFEFINYFSEIEPYITTEFARNSNKILIRSYFYAKAEGKVKGWRSYIDQFITYAKVPTSDGREELKRYLLAEYKLDFVENEDLEKVCDLQKVETLAQSMLESDAKENIELAHNAALLVHGIYGLRRKDKETSAVTEYGLRTWWMTNQSRVLRHTIEIIRENGAKYIMRPEYILNFIAMSPNCEEVRRNLKEILPSNFGVQLGHRLKDDVFHGVLADVAKWKEYEPGRITALMSDLSDRLKGDRLKRYEHNLYQEEG